MARKKSSRSTPNNADPDAQSRAEIEAAEEGVRRAKEELKKARQAYQEIRKTAVDQLKQVREMSFGELVDDALRRVRQHPGPGVLIAALVGFFLGRLFRR